MQLDFTEKQYERLDDKSIFSIRRDEEKGGYTIWYSVNEESYGWPMPKPIPALTGLPDEATAETVLMRLRQMDIDVHAQMLLGFRPKPEEPKAVEEPTPPPRKTG